MTTVCDYCDADLDRVSGHLVGCPECGAVACNECMEHGCPECGCLEAIEEGAEHGDAAVEQAERVHLGKGGH